MRMLLYLILMIVHQIRWEPAALDYREGSEELNAGEVFEEIGGSVWRISVVNDHVLSIAGIDKCVFMILHSRKELKSLSYDYGRAGFLSMKDQFIVYCDEIKYCLNAGQRGSRSRRMVWNNLWKICGKQMTGTYVAPMKAWNDTVVCVTTKSHL